MGEISIILQGLKEESFKKGFVISYKNYREIKEMRYIL